MSDLEVELRKSLPEFPNDELEKLLQYLRKLGVYQFRDLEFLERQELLDSDFLTKVHAGRLFRSLDIIDAKPLPKPKQKTTDDFKEYLDSLFQREEEKRKLEKENEEKEKAKQEKKQDRIRNMYDTARRIQDNREARSQSPSTAWANLDSKAREEYERKLHREMKENYEQSVRDIWAEPEKQNPFWSAASSPLNSKREEFVQAEKSHLLNVDIKKEAVPTAGAMIAGVIGYCVTGSISVAGAVLIAGGLALKGVALGASQIFTSETDQCNMDADNTENIASEQN